MGLTENQDLSWMQIQEIINHLQQSYDDINVVKEYISKEENYETDNKNVNLVLFYLVKKLKEKLEKMPENVEEIMNNTMKLGNDTYKIANYLTGLEKDLKNVITAYQTIKAHVEIAPMEYDFGENPNNSLSYKFKEDYVKKIVHFMNNDDMSIDEKYEHYDSFDKNLNNEEKGELKVQALIGKEDPIAYAQLVNKYLFSGMEISNSAQIMVIMKKFERAYIQAGAYAQQKLSNESFEEILEDYKTILDSPFYRNLQKEKTKKGL